VPRRFIINQCFRGRCRLRFQGGRNTRARKNIRRLLTSNPTSRYLLSQGPGYSPFDMLTTYRPAIGKNTKTYYIIYEGNASSIQFSILSATLKSF
jgi:hypothetical protein